MTENDLPAEAIADPRTFTDEGALHGLLARLRRTDPLPFYRGRRLRPVLAGDSPRRHRKPNRQLAFGTGPHVCLGQYLARFEPFFRELLARVEHIELAGEPRVVEGSFVGGVKYLPVRYRMR